MQNNYQLLIDKLNEFIRKYYKNQLVKGGLYFVGFAGTAFLAVTLLEYFGNFNPLFRAILLFWFLSIATFCLIKYLIVPGFKLVQLGKTLSYEEAAIIIGNHFRDVKDKLLNTLQLNKVSRDVAQQDLINASINQRIDELKPISFKSAVNFSENKKYLKLAMPPLAILLLILFIDASVITSSTERLVHYNQEFVRKSPFEFFILNESLEVPKQEDLELKVGLKGDFSPTNAYIEIKGNLYKLNRKSSVEFQYLIRNIQEDENIRFFADGFYSKSFKIRALPKPTMLNFSVKLDYPSYTGNKDEVVNNVGDFTVPAGTRIKWSFKTKNTESILFSVFDSIYNLNQSDQGLFEFNGRFLSNTSYQAFPVNQYVKNKNGLPYQINVIPDLYPSIDVEERIDSLSIKQRYFKGNIKDDYGFSKLTLNYRISGKDSSSSWVSEAVPYQQNNSLGQFYHYWDASSLALSSGDKVEYYFEIWDNDGVYGAKSSKSKTNVFKLPSLEELSKKVDENKKKTKENIKKTLKEVEDLKKELNKINRDLKEKKELSWQDQKKIEDIIKRQKELENNINQLNNENEKNNRENNEFSPPSKELLEKQQQIEKLMEDVLDDETKVLMKELEELMKEFNKDKVQEKLEDLELSQEDLQKELDRSLEQLKQLEFEQKLENITNKLEELSKEQEELSKETKEKNTDNQENKEKQEDIKEKFEDIKKELDELEKKNQELEKPNDMENLDEEEKNVEEEMQNSSDQLDKNKQNKASESQKKAAQNMQEMQQKLEEMAQNMQAQNIQEDLDALRAILENLIQLSFDQEDLMGDMKSVNYANPKYVDFNKTQKKLNDDAKIIEDSLFALSKRLLMLETTIHKEMNQVNENMKEAVKIIEKRNAPKARQKQQYVMTSLNNLSLLLSELLKSMQMQMAQQMQGESNCQKPGSGSKPMQSKGIGQSQKQLSEQLKKMLGDMKKRRGKNQSGKSKTSEEIAKMAAKQAAIRRQLEQMANEMNKDGSGKGNELKKWAKEMEQIEKNLVNKNITPELLKRQQDITVRLLKSEKAQLERELDQKRKSDEAKKTQKSNPEDYFEYTKKIGQETEVFKTLPPSLKPYYKRKAGEYLDRLQLK